MTALLGDPVLTRAWVGVSALLVLGTLLSWLFHRRRASPETCKTLLRVRTWWLIVACLFVAMSLGPPGLAGLFCLVTLAALGEFVNLDKRAPRRGIVWTVLALGAVTVYALLALHSALIRSWPAWSALLFMMGTALVAATGSTRRGLLSLGAFLLGACGLACVVGLSQVGADRSAACTGIRLVFVLLLLTGLNDIAQYLWGKGLGRRPVVPHISPRKTWAGFVGGVITTAFLAAALAPSFTAEGRQWGLLTGLLIGVGGFAGDILASAYKRRVGACESGTLLPGHGGIIDRIDSLCVTAPLLYCAVRFS